MTAGERVDGQSAFILLRRAYRESSLLIETLTADHGRVALVARGARGTARRGGALALLQHYRLSWVRRGELGTLTGAEAIETPKALRGERLIWMWYANELLMRALARDDPHADIYTAYVAMLDALSARPSDSAPANAGVEEAALRRFEWQLLCALGYQPAVQGVDELLRYDYHAVRGAHADHRGRITGAGLSAALAGEFDTPDACLAARLIFQAHLPQLIGDQPLRTPAMLRRLRTTTERTHV